MPGSLSVNSWKPSWRSCAGCVPMPPQISTTLPAALPGPPSSFDGIFAGRPADQHVVAADELRVLVGIDVAVEHEDRDLGIDRLLDDAGQAGRIPSAR